MPRIVGKKNPKAIGKRFLQAREASGLSQRQVAAETGMTAAYISRIEAGARVPTIDALREFAVPLGVDADWLLNGVSGAPPTPMSNTKVTAALRAIRDARDALDEAWEAVDQLRKES